MTVSIEKQKQLQKRMQNLGIFEEDLEEKFILSSGKGGQKVQKSSTCVYLKHLPTGIEVKCGKERLRSLNRFFSRRMLCDKFEEKFFPARSKKTQKTEKIRRQKKRRKRRHEKNLPKNESPN